MAEVIRHVYLNGIDFYTVECDQCLIVLNSGHHYRFADLGDAFKLADDHNDQEHSNG